MDKRRYEEILNNLIGWAYEHEDEFIECFVRASGMTQEEAKYFEIEEKHFN